MWKLIQVRELVERGNSLSDEGILAVYGRENVKIPGRVTPKARPRINGKQAYLPSNYRVWRNSALIELLTQDKPLNPLKSACVQILFYGSHIGDLDNLAGAVLDSMVEAQIIQDDRLSVVKELAIKHIKSKETFCEIVLESY